MKAIKLFLLLLLTLTMLIVYTIALSFGRGEPFVADGLVSFWTFDEEDIEGKKVKDIWGGNDGMMVGKPESVDGKIDQALSFNGTSDMVEVPGNDDLTQIGTDSVTAEAWINVEKPCHGVINGRPFWILHWSGCAGLPVGMRFYIGAGGWKSVTSKTTVKEGWHHWVGVYDGKELKVYLDGKEDGSVGSGGKLASTGDGTPDWLTFGKDYHTTVNNDRWNKVIIDEVRVYNRALTDAEVEQNFLAESNTSLVIGGQTGALEGAGNPSWFDGMIDEVLIYDGVVSENDIQEAKNGLSSLLGVKQSGKLAITWGQIKNQ